jgi:hypothetical protein
MRHPYEDLPGHHFWPRADTAEWPVIDGAPKFRFSLADDDFATAGSCFAQHFGRALIARGGRLHFAEARHPLIAEDAAHGYGVFSARYGNLYTPRQFRECLDQAFARRPVVEDFAQREDGRWIDLLRPRAVPEGFGSQEEAAADRHYHLSRVKAMVETCRALVFTLGLTETWLNVAGGYSYGLCPGVAGGSFDPAVHRFHNLGFRECVADLDAVAALCRHANPTLRLLLTVSPVMLVATMEARGAIQSSVASKGILRAAADDCVRRFDHVDYFPSFEIITHPLARGRFYAADGREVTQEGVAAVMDVFFNSRMEGVATPAAPRAAEPRAAAPPAEELARLDAIFEAECDELLLARRQG